MPAQLKLGCQIMTTIDTVLSPKCPDKPKVRKADAKTKEGDRCATTGATAAEHSPLSEHSLKTYK